MRQVGFCVSWWRPAYSLSSVHFGVGCPRRPLIELLVGCVHLLDMDMLTTPPPHPSATVPRVSTATGFSLPRRQPRFSAARSPRCVRGGPGAVATARRRSSSAEASAIASLTARVWIDDHTKTANGDLVNGVERSQRQGRACAADPAATPRWAYVVRSFLVPDPLTRRTRSSPYRPVSYGY
jgi:hypothetical protein